MSTSFIGISKIFFIVAGIGCGTIFYISGRFSNVINRLQMLMKKSLKYGNGAEVAVEDVDYVQIPMKESLKHGDGAEVAVEDIDSTHVQIPIKESLKYGDGAEVAVEDVDSTNVQLAVKESTNSGDHVEGEDAADSTYTQLPVKGFPNSEDRIEGEDADSTDAQLLVEGSVNSRDQAIREYGDYVQMDDNERRIFEEFTGLKNWNKTLDEIFKLPEAESGDADSDYSKMADDERRIFQEFTGLKFTGLKDFDQTFKIGPSALVRKAPHMGPV